VITPLAFIRGRSLSNIFFIIDEAQNLTPHEVKTIITRAGEGTKIVFTGDIHQIDTPYLDSQSNGLSHMIDKIKNQSLYAHVTLEKGERSELANIANELL
jgi:PhoH-like ATPase